MIDQFVDWVSGQRHFRYGSAVTRMMVGFVLTTMLVLNWPDRRYGWGPGAAWIDPVRPDRSWPDSFAWLTRIGPHWFDLVYVVLILASVAMIVGWRTRLVTIVSLIGFTSMTVANPYITAGGEAVLRIVLAYLCFVDAGGMWSLDARRERRRTVVPDWVVTLLHNVAVVLIIHQVVMVYVASAFYKLQGSTWRDGTAVYYPLQTQAFSPWMDVLHPIYAWAPFIVAGSWSAIVVQLMFPVLMFYRPTRVFALITITGMHLTIGFFMGIMYFSLVMIAVDMLLVTDASWRRAESVITRRKRDPVHTRPEI